MTSDGTITAMKTSAAVDLSTDFSTVGNDGLLHARRDWFAPGASVAVGTTLRVGDPDDAVWSATVVEAGPVWVSLRLQDQIS